jgi:NAD(P)H-nitrite reductase large subunit
MHHCLICRCEEITDQEVIEAIVAGARTVNDVKRQTRAGMGVCQGVYCVGEIAKMLQEATGTPAGEIALVTARPPVRLVPVDRIAARGE